MDHDALKDFTTFLSFQSVSTDPAYKPELLNCCDWVCDYLKDIGFEVEVWETSGHPTIYAHYLKAGPDKPTLLTYNHYDVQPVDPVEEWSHPPFEPHIENGKVYARGASDNKGQCFYTLLAMKTLLKNEGKLPINVKMVIEGEEEIGSSGLDEILETKKEKLRADYIAIVDSGMNSPTKPAITLGMRGIVTMEVTARGSNSDLHSGMVGGMVFNPIHALVHTFSQIRDPKTGRILIPGFYDQVKTLTPLEKEQLKNGGDPDAFLEPFKAKPTGGERALNAWERVWMQPTLEVNGITGGYTGEGFKTVIPQVAKAKVSCRLVPDQDPKKMGMLVGDALIACAPDGIDITVSILAGSGRAARGNPDSPIVHAFSKAYKEVFNHQPELIYSGGSVPISARLQEVSMGEIVFVGLALATDNFHAPNEHFSIERIDQGCQSMINMLKHLS